MSSFFPAVAVGAALVWFVVLMNHSRTRIPLLTATGVMLILSSAGVVTGPLVGVVTRPVGVALIALAALTSPLARAAGAHGTAGRFAQAVCGPLAVYVAVVTVPHGQWTQFALYVAALCLPVILIVSTGSHLPLRDLRRGITLGLLLTVIGSFILGATRPDLGIESGRLRGLLENANGLGFVAFLLGALAILVRTRWSRLSLVLAAIALVWTASRASALALLALGLLDLLRRRRYGLVAALTAALVLSVVVLTSLNVPIGPLEGLLRTNDSRSGSLNTASADFGSSPLWGVGLNSESSIIASSPLRALSNGGVLGLLCVVVQGVLMLRSSLVSGRATVLAAAGLLHSLFEGWLLSPSSPFLLTFAVVWILVVRSTPPGTTASTDHYRATRRPALVGRQNA